MLGPLVVERAGHSIDVARGRQRALLIALLLRVGKVVPSERLIDDVWAASPPADPAHALQQTVSQLRRVLRGGGAVEEWLVWHPSGYQLAVDPDAVDITQFEQLAELGRRQLAAGDPAAAAGTLRRALDLWRGAALSDVADLPFGQAAAIRLAERRLAVVEDRIEADQTVDPRPAHSRLSTHPADGNPGQSPASRAAGLVRDLRICGSRS